MKTTAVLRHMRRSLTQRLHRLTNRAGLPSTVRIVLGTDRSYAPLVATVRADYITIRHNPLP